jgi:hypothetical protein
MHESGALSWREVVETHHSALVDELSKRLDSDLREAVSLAVAAEHSQARASLKLACDDARRSQTESLNQVLRRFRAASEDNVLALVAEGCAAYAERVVVLVFENNQARTAAAAGIHSGVHKHDALVPNALAQDVLTFDVSLLTFDISLAPAIIAAIENRDPMVALSTGGEISPALAEVLDAGGDSKVYLFPVVARHSVVAMLVASGVYVSAPVELICEAAGMRLESTGSSVARVASPLTSQAAEGSPFQVAAGLVHLAPGVPASETAGPRSWQDLTQEDQKLHLQAQRMARVRVAEMRLYHENELRSGIAAGDIYSELQKEINAARDQFLQTFLSKSPTMVDYLHLEILRSLVHDDDRLLGHSYPGPMV